MEGGEDCWEDWRHADAYPNDLFSISVKFHNTVDSRYLEVEGILRNNSRYPYFDISDFQNWRNHKWYNQISQKSWN